MSKQFTFNVGDCEGCIECGRCPGCCVVCSNSATNPVTTSTVPDGDYFTQTLNTQGSWITSEYGNTGNPTGENSTLAVCIVIEINDAKSQPASYYYDNLAITMPDGWEEATPLQYIGPADGTFLDPFIPGYSFMAQQMFYYENSDPLTQIEGITVSGLPVTYSWVATGEFSGYLEENGVTTCAMWLGMTEIKGFPDTWATFDQSAWDNYAGIPTTQPTSPLTAQPAEITVNCALYEYYFQYDSGLPSAVACNFATYGEILILGALMDIKWLTQETQLQASYYYPDTYGLAQAGAIASFTCPICAQCTPMYPYVQYSYTLTVPTTWVNLGNGCDCGVTAGDYDLIYSTSCTYISEEDNCLGQPLFSLFMNYQNHAVYLTIQNGPVALGNPGESYIQYICDQNAFQPVTGITTMTLFENVNPQWCTGASATVTITAEQS